MVEVQSGRVVKRKKRNGGFERDKLQSKKFSLNIFLSEIVEMLCYLAKLANIKNGELNQDSESFNSKIW